MKAGSKEERAVHATCDAGRLKCQKLSKNGKNIALVFGLLSATSVVFDVYPYIIFFSLPFCTIWINCAWRRSELQLKWINIIFFASMDSVFSGIFVLCN